MYMYKKFHKNTENGLKLFLDCALELLNELLEQTISLLRFALVLADEDFNVILELLTEWQLLVSLQLRVLLAAGEADLRAHVVEASVRCAEVDREDVEFVVELLLLLVVIVVLLQ